MGAGFIFVARILAHLHLQGNGIAPRESIRLEIIMVLGEAVIAHVAHHGGGAFRLSLKGLLGEPVSRLDGDVERVGIEVLRETAPLRHVIDDAPDLDAVAGDDAVDDGSPLLLEGHFAGDLRIVVAQVAEMLADLVLRHPDQTLFEGDFLPVIQEARGLLLDVGRDVGEFQVRTRALDFDLVLG